jgi:hypothetical protein
MNFAGRGATMRPAMNDLRAFDGDGERARQIVDLRVKGKTEVEVCQMLGCTVPNIHRALDRAARASMTPAARVRDIFVDKSRLEVYEQSVVPAAIGGDVQRLRRRFGFRSGSTR